MVVSRPFYEYSCPDCGGKHPVAETVLPPDYFGSLTTEVNELINALHAGKKSTTGILKLVGNLLTSKVSDSYNIKTDWTTPDIQMLHRLTRDVWSFSAAKNYQQMRDLTLALKDENGKLREFDAFKTEAQKVCTKYNETWLRTEYDMSIASSQSAARWVDFTKDAKDIPFLEYQTVGDDAVRASHAALDGIVRNIKDTFWSTHYPPNGWGCRCEVLQSVGATGDKKDIPAGIVPEMFRTNLAQTGLIYPKNHPYYVGIPKAEIRKAIAYLPPENTYLTTNIGNKIVIDIHPLHGDKELSINVDACKTLLSHDKKAKLKLLPIIEVNAKTKASDIKARELFFGKEYQKKYPLKNGDVIYNNNVVEFESPIGSKKSIQHAVEHGIKQADKVIIHLPDDVDINQAYNTVNGHVLAHYPDSKNEIWLMNNAELKQYKRQKRQ